MPLHGQRAWVGKKLVGPRIRGCHKVSHVDALLPYFKVEDKLPQIPQSMLSLN